MARKIIKTCVDVALPDELQFAAMQAALAENSANAPAIPKNSFLPGAFPDPGRLAALTGKLWKPGRTLRVRFLDGDPTVQAKIAPFANEWTKVANIKFEFGNDPDAEIRISFKQPGSWSYIGTDCLTIPKSQPTMNYGWLNKSTANDEYSRVVVHEFGHSIGCIHEHQNPSTNIPWDKPTVYKYYQGPPNNWTKAQTDVNLFTRYGADMTQFSEFDRQSIMLYPVPEEFTVGDFTVGWNKVMSATDKTFVATLYPLVSKLENEIKVDAPYLSASIGAFQEVDTYNFRVDNGGKFKIETEGNSDMSVSLFGPDDATRMIDQDDDSGRRLNARILAELKPGVYTARVRHFSDKRTGDYQIGVFTVV
jgi:hypothetical protein